MTTSTVNYLGKLRTEATHTHSSAIIITDAPTDNHGEGKNFSPTDLLATALASCMITLIGIVAAKHHLKLGAIRADIYKTMSELPRQVKKVQVIMHFPESDYTVKEKKLIENAALTCPVALSLNSDIDQDVKFIYE